MEIIVRNQQRFFLVGNVGAVFTILGYMMIIGINLSFSYIDIAFLQIFVSYVPTNPWMVLFAIFIVSFVVSKILLSILGVGMDAQMHCFIIDQETQRKNG